MATFNPRFSRSVPSEAAVSPLPRELTTPPVTKIYLVCFIFLKSKETDPEINVSVFTDLEGETKAEITEVQTEIEERKERGYDSSQYY